jgi:hypothetical protein
VLASGSHTARCVEIADIDDNNQFGIASVECIILASGLGYLAAPQPRSFGFKKKTQTTCPESLGLAIKSFYVALPLLYAVRFLLPSPPPTAVENPSSRAIPSE